MKHFSFRNLMLAVIALWAVRTGGMIWKEKMPVAKAGSCVAMGASGVHITAQVLYNDSDKDSSMLSFYRKTLDRSYMEVSMHYSVMREFHSKVIKCPIE